MEKEFRDALCPFRLPHSLPFFMPVQSRCKSEETSISWIYRSCATDKDQFGIKHSVLYRKHTILSSILRGQVLERSYKGRGHEKDIHILGLRQHIQRPSTVQTAHNPIGWLLRSAPSLVVVSTVRNKN